METPQGLCFALDGSGPYAANPDWTRIDLGHLNPRYPRVTGVQITRGRQNEFTKIGGGTMHADFVDPYGYLDPTNSHSPLYTLVDPVIQVAYALKNPTTGAWTTVFRGHLSDPEFTIDVSGKFATVAIDFVDAFDLFSTAEVIPGQAGDIPWAYSPGDAYYTGGFADDRILAAASDATNGAWPGGLTDVNSGNVTLQPVVYPGGTPILNVMQDAADGEFPGIGKVFMSRAGLLTFHGRYIRFNPTNAFYGLGQWNLGDGVAVTEDEEIRADRRPQVPPRHPGPDQRVPRDTPEHPRRRHRIVLRERPRLDQPVRHPHRHLPEPPDRRRPRRGDRPPERGVPPLRPNSTSRITARHATASAKSSSKQ